MVPFLSLYRNAFTQLSRNIWILSAAMFVNRSGSMVLVFSSLYFTKDLHFSIAEAGMIMSFYGAGSIAGSYAGGWMTDRSSYREIMICSLIGSGLSLLLLLLHDSQLYLSLVIFLHAFVADTFRPASSAAIASYSLPENRTRSVALFRLAINLGFSVGPAAGGFIALYFGYKWLFIIDALTSISAATMLVFFLPAAKTVRNKENNNVLKDSRTSAYRDLNYLFFIFLSTAFGICFFQLIISVPQYFSKVCFYNEDTIGLLLALNGLLVVLAEMPFVTAMEKKSNIFHLIIAGAICLPVSFAILLIGNESLFAAIAYMVVVTMAEMLAMPFMMNYSLSRAPKERQGQYAALYSISFGIANVAAPSIGLGIADHFGFDKMFAFFILMGALTAAGFYFMNKKNYL